MLSPFSWALDYALLKIILHIHVMVVSCWCVYALQGELLLWLYWKFYPVLGNAKLFKIVVVELYSIHTHTHTRLTAPFPGLPGWAGTRKVKPMWILLKQETVSGGGISWAICKSAPCSRQITMPAPHHSVFYRPDALPAAQQRQSTEGQFIFNT